MLIRISETYENYENDALSNQRTLEGRGQSIWVENEFVYMRQGVQRCSVCAHHSVST
jgi:hypothetical protein